MLQAQEIFDSNLSPPSLENNNIRPINNDLPELIYFKIPPINNLSEYDAKFNQIQFNINSTNLMDPYGLYLEMEISNPNAVPIQLDGSAHSLISQIALYSNVNIYIYNNFFYNLRA